MIKQGNKQVLFVENNPIVAKPISLCLKSAGYKVFVAQSPSEADRCLSENIIHVMIVDKRLGNDKDPEDALGFTFAKQRPQSIPCIVFTAYDENNSMHHAWKDLRANDFINKRDPEAIEHLLTSLKTAFDELHSNFDLEIHSTPCLDEIAKKIELSKKRGLQSPTADDLNRVLQSLFHQADQVELKPLLSQKSIQRTESYLMIAKQHRQEGWCSQVVVKFTGAGDIEVEKQKYKTFTPLLGGQRIPQLKENDTAYSHEIGGLVYSLVREDDLGDIIPFDVYYQNHKAEKINSLLDNFFKITFNNLYQDAPRVYWDLFQIYADQLRLTPKILVKAAKQLREDHYNTPLLQFEGLPTKLPNPIPWAIIDSGFRSMERLVRHCFVHGDLHGRNMLVDKHDYIWLIDFERAEDSHALRDFVELETDIKFNILKQIDIATLFKFETSLLEPQQFHQLVPLLSNVDANTKKAYQVICHLRQIAGNLIQTEGNMKEYYEALFVHTLNILRLKHILPQKKEHALMAAALMCQRLENWPKRQTESISGHTEKDQINQKPKNESEHISNINQISWSGIIKTGFVVLLLILSILALFWATSTFQINRITMFSVIFITIPFIILILTMIGLVSGNSALQSLEKLTQKFLENAFSQIRKLFESNNAKETDNDHA
jgi:CheY-like chemotaxis protein